MALRGCVIGTFVLGYVIHEALGGNGFWLLLSREVICLLTSLPGTDSVWLLPLVVCVVSLVLDGAVRAVFTGVQTLCE